MIGLSLVCVLRKNAIIAQGERTWTQVPVYRQIHILLSEDLDLLCRVISHVQPSGGRAALLHKVMVVSEGPQFGEVMKVNLDDEKWFDKDEDNVRPSSIPMPSLSADSTRTDAEHANVGTRSAPPVAERTPGNDADSEALDITSMKENGGDSPVPLPGEAPLPLPEEGTSVPPSKKKRRMSTGGPDSKVRAHCEHLDRSTHTHCHPSFDPPPPVQVVDVDAAAALSAKLKGKQPNKVLLKKQIRSYGNRSLNVRDMHVCECNLDRNAHHASFD